MDYGWTSCEDENIVMRTDAKNHVTTSRTIHLLEKGNNPQDFYVAKRSLFGSVNGLAYLVQNIHAHKGEVCFLPECRQKFSRAAHREGPRQVMFAETQHTGQQLELNTCEHKSQDATKITSVFADSRIQFLWSVMSIFVRALCLCFVLLFLLLSVAHPSSSFVIVALSIPHCVVKSDRSSLDDDSLKTYYEALALSRHSINLELRKT